MSPPDAPPSHPVRRFATAVVILLAVFSVPLFRLTTFAFHSSLYSHLVLIPAVSLYLVWNLRGRLGPAEPPVSRTWGMTWIIAGLAFGAGYLALAFSPVRHPVEDSLAFAVYSFVCLTIACACLFLGRNHLRLLAFPLAFLVFLAPFPSAVEAGLEHFLQHGSALTAHGIFRLVGTPVFREGTYFRLPGFSMEVAPECSGIHSTLALFLTSLVAGQLLLRRPWSRVVLAAVVLPIALLRNGFRVFTIGELCVHVGPHMIDSYIHRHGGPIFFVLSLIPFSAILYYLLQSDRKANRPPPSSSRA